MTTALTSTSNVSKLIECAICYEDKPTSKMGLLPHLQNVACRLHKNKELCIDCLSQITLLCPVCRQKIKPIASNPSIPVHMRLLTLIRRFTYLDPTDELSPATITERIVSAIARTFATGLSIGLFAATIGLGEGYTHQYDYFEDNESIKNLVLALFASAFL